MSDRLQGQVALITGAGSGIGAATAAQFARKGAAVALADLARETLEPVAGRVASAGGQALVTVSDVTRRANAVVSAPEAASVRVWHLMSRLTGNRDGATTRGARSC